MQICTVDTVVLGPKALRLFHRKVISRGWFKNYLPINFGRFWGSDLNRSPALMVLDAHRQLARSRAFNRVVLTARKSEPQIVRIVADYFASTRVPISTDALRNEIDPALRDVTTRRDELDLIRCRDKRQHTRARWSDIDRNAVFKGAEIFLVPKIKNVHGPILR